MVNFNNLRITAIQFTSDYVIVLLLLYYRLARKEEKDMEEEFGSQYTEYMKRTSMFIPLPMAK